MGDSHIWVLSNFTILLIDVSNYGVKEWLAIVASVIGIGGSIFGVWRGWRYSKSQIAARLKDYLQDEEEKIKEGRNRIIRHLRWGRPLDSGLEHQFYEEVKTALDENGDPRQAERKLGAIADTLACDVKVGEKFVSNANLQLATLLLIRGRSANERAETAAARDAWNDALQCYSYDAEAERYLGELALAEGLVKIAVKHFRRAYSFAPDDKLLKAETWEAVAGFYQQQGRRRLELEALAACAPYFADAAEHNRAAIAFERAGELAAQLNRNQQAPVFLRAAFDNHRQSGNLKRMTAVRDNLKNLGQDVSGLQLVNASVNRQMPWREIRIGTELVLLCAGALLFYLSLR